MADSVVYSVGTFTATLTMTTDNAPVGTNLDVVVLVGLNSGIG